MSSPMHGVVVSEIVKVNACITNVENHLYRS